MTASLRLDNFIMKLDELADDCEGNPFVLANVK